MGACRLVTFLGKMVLTCALLQSMRDLLGAQNRHSIWLSVKLCMVADCRQDWPPDLEGDADAWQQALDSQVASARAHEEEHRKHIMMMDGTMQLQLLGEAVLLSAKMPCSGLTTDAVEAVGRC